MHLRTFIHIDVLQPQLAGFFQTVSSGFQPLAGQAALIVEIAPGIAINNLTDAALKHTRVLPGMQIVERSYGLVEVHHFDQGDVRAAGEAMLERAGLKVEDRMTAEIVSREVIHGIDAHQAMLVNRMRHGHSCSRARRSTSSRSRPRDTRRSRPTRPRRPPTSTSSRW